MTCQIQGCFNSASTWVKKVDAIVGQRVMHVCRRCATEMIALFRWTRA